MPTMEADRWQRIEEIFHQALHYSEADRDSYLAVACDGDQSLLQEVVSLISSHELTGNFLDTPQLSAGLRLLAARDADSYEGEIVGRYLLQSLIGRGGMGDVYLALDQRLGRNVALKLLPNSFVNDPDWVSRFENEAKAASSIAHSNIAHVYEVGEAEGKRYIAMEYIDGVTLREHLQRGRLSPLEAIDITTQVAQALMAAHSAGVLHRDIKPDNIMLHRDGYAKVLDFGLAKSTTPLSSREGREGLFSAVTTEAGIIVGSPAYMSPEQARALKVDHRSDLWSLGVVLYELLTQTGPFLADTPSDTIAAILKSEPAPLRLLAPGPSEELEPIVTKLLAKSVTDRYQDAQSLISDLQSLRERIRYPRTVEPLPEPSAVTNDSDRGSHHAPPRAGSSGLRQPTQLSHLGHPLA